MSIGKLLIKILALAVVTSLTSCIWFPSAREPGYQHILSWGKTGEDPGEFREPIGIAIEGSEVFVSEAGNNRIQVFDLEGNFLYMFGHEGKGSGELGRPMLIDIKDNRIYVPEYLNDRVQVFSLTGEPLETIGSSGKGAAEFDAPGGVAIGEDGKLYVADFYNHRIQVLGPEGSLHLQLGETGVKGIRAGLFNYPTDVALLPGGDIVVADAYNDRIQVFTPDGKFLRKWGGPFAIDIHGSFNGWFKTSTAVTVGPEGNIFVADFYNHRIQKFSPKGDFLVAFGSRGKELGKMKFPIDVALDKEGSVYVVDFGNNRIQKFMQIKLKERKIKN